MKLSVRFLAVLLCLATVLWGCQRSTTVILPPETTPTTTSGAEIQPSTGTTAPASTTQATTEPVTEPTAVPSTEAATVPATEPTAAPTATPTTEPEPTQHPVYDISGHSIGSLEYSLLDAINGQRAAAELPALTMDHTLSALAAIRACECAESFSHTRPDGRGAFTVLSDHGYYIWPHLNERIHYGTSGLSSGTILKGWMRNADFSASILSADFTHIGIGVYTSGGTDHIVCFFAG